MTDEPMDDNELAAEYVVGLLPEDLRAEVADRIERDQAFAAKVTTWENHFASFNQAYGDEMPHERVKRAIDARLFIARTQQKNAVGSWFRRLWLGGVAVAALAVLVLWFGLPDGTDDYELIATLETVEQGFVFQAGYDADNNKLTITPVSGSLPQGRDLELWAIPDGGAPISLGVIAQGAATTALPNVAITSGVTLAVSLEPLGGSPTGAPTGPVLSAGVLEDV